MTLKHENVYVNVFVRLVPTKKSRPPNGGGDVPRAPCRVASPSGDLRPPCRPTRRPTASCPTPVLSDCVLSAPVFTPVFTPAPFGFSGLACFGAFVLPVLTLTVGVESPSGLACLGPEAGFGSSFAAGVLSPPVLSPASGVLSPASGVLSPAPASMSGVLSPSVRHRGPLSRASSPGVSSPAAGVFSPAAGVVSPLTDGFSPDFESCSGAAPFGASPLEGTTLSSCAFADGTLSRRGLGLGRRGAWARSAGR